MLHGGSPRSADGSPHRRTIAAGVAPSGAQRYCGIHLHDFGVARTASRVLGRLRRADGGARRLPRPTSPPATRPSRRTRPSRSAVYGGPRRRVAPEWVYVGCRMALPTSGSTALSHLRICDLTGQLAGAGATKFLAAFGAQVIRVEDPGPPRHLGHPARRATVRRRAPRHQPRRRVQQPQRREARDHDRPPPGARQGAPRASWSPSPTRSPRTSPPACSRAWAFPTTSWRGSRPIVQFEEHGCNSRYDL